MSGIYNHRPMVPGRSAGVPEWLDLIKQEFESLSHEAMLAKAQRDECEHKIVNQIQEMEGFRRAIFDLERKHESMKTQYHMYEEEVVRLRREVEQRGGVVQVPHQMAHAQPPPPNIGHGHTNLFGGIISGGPGGPGGPGLVAPPQMVDPQQQQAQQQQAHQQAQQQQHQQQAQQSQQAQAQQQQQHMQQVQHQQQQHHQQQQQQHVQQPQQQHPYGGPMPPGPGGPHSPYMNGSNGQPQKRFKTENDGPRFKQEADAHPPGGPPGSMYGNMSPNPHGNPNGPPPGMGPNYSSPVPTPTSSKPPKGAPYIQQGREESGSNAAKRKAGASAVSTPTTVARTIQGGSSSSTNWSDDPDNKLTLILVLFSDYDSSNPKVPQQLKVDLLHTMEHSSVVCCVRFSADGKYLATGCNRSAQIFDIQTGQSVCVLADDTAGKDDLYIRSVCFSPDGKFLATGAEDKLIRIWEIGRKKIRMVLKGHDQDIYSLDFSRDGRIIVSGSGDQTARVWDMETSKCIHELTVGDEDLKDAGVTSVAISPDGRLVAAGSLDRMVRVWDTHSGKLLEKLEGHKESVYSVVFTPDGKTLISGSLDKTLKAWDLNLSGWYHGQNNGRRTICKSTFTGHKDFVLSVAVSPDGKWVVSGSKDRGVQFWDPNTTNVQFMLQGHKNSVISVALSPQGTYFATGSGDTRARVWSYEPTEGHM
ncbi:general transcription repressor [Gryganskiella cystojenkinii]|nr:general transcription repressor [Gryganskiella cystojenkinii]